MALTYGFCLGSEGTEYSSKDFADAIHAVVGDGISRDLKQFGLTTNGLTATLDTGFALPAGRYLENQDKHTLTLSASSNIQDRFDALAVRVDYAERKAALRILENVDPEKIRADSGIIRDNDAYSLILYFIRVRRGATSIAIDDITDARDDERVCGWLIPYSAISGQAIGVYDYLRTGLDEAISALMGDLDKALRTGDRALAYLDRLADDITGNALGDVVLSAVHPPPETHWLLCNGGAVPEGYQALAQLLDGTLPDLPQEDERLKAWIFGAEAREYTGGHDDDTYTVLAPVSPTGAGTASGAGTYRQGSMVSLTAAPAAKSEFVGWQEGGAQISEDKSYRFPVYCNRTISAIFAALYQISLSVDPEGAGTVSGAGTYRNGTLVTVKATASNVLRKFTEWKENGQTVSKNASYTFTINADRALVAMFAVLRVPSNYAELQWIEMKIGTGIKVDVAATITTTRVVMDVMVLEVPTSYNGFLFAGCNNLTPGAIITAYTNKSSKISTQVGTYSTSPTNTALSLTANKRTVIDMDTLYRTLKIDNSSTPISVSSSSMDINWQTGQGFKFGYNYPGLSDTVAGVHMLLYSAQIYVDNVLKGDFIPCKRPDGKVGMYNTLTATFCFNENYNIGNSEPIAGPVI